MWLAVRQMMISIPWAFSCWAQAAIALGVGVFGSTHSADVVHGVSKTSLQFGMAVPCKHTGLSVSVREGNQEEAGQDSRGVQEAVPGVLALPKSDVAETTEEAVSPGPCSGCLVLSAAGSGATCSVDP